MANVDWLGIAIPGLEAPLRQFRCLGDDLTGEEGASRMLKTVPVPVSSNMTLTSTGPWTILQLRRARDIRVETLFVQQTSGRRTFSAWQLDEQCQCCERSRRSQHGELHHKSFASDPQCRMKQQRDGCMPRPRSSKHKQRLQVYQQQTTL